MDIVRALTLAVLNFQRNTGRAPTDAEVHEMHLVLKREAGR